METEPQTVNIEFKLVFQRLVVKSAKNVLFSQYGFIQINDVVRLEKDKIFVSYTVVGREVSIRLDGNVSDLTFLVAEQAAYG